MKKQKRNEDKPSQADNEDKSGKSKRQGRLKKREGPLPVDPTVDPRQPLKPAPYEFPPPPETLPIHGKQIVGARVYPKNTQQMSKKESDQSDDPGRPKLPQKPLEGRGYCPKRNQVANMKDPLKRKQWEDYYKELEIKEKELREYRIRVGEVKLRALKGTYKGQASVRKSSRPKRDNLNNQTMPETKKALHDESMKSHNSATSSGTEIMEEDTLPSLIKRPSRAKSCSNVNKEEAGEAIKRAKSMKNVSRVKKSNENAQQPEKPLHHPMPDLSHIGFRNISNRWASADIANSEIKSKRGSDGSNASGVSKPPSGRTTRPMSQSGRVSPFIAHASNSQSTRTNIVPELNEKEILQQYRKLAQLKNENLQTELNMDHDKIASEMRKVIDESKKIPITDIFNEVERSKAIRGVLSAASMNVDNSMYYMDVLEPKNNHLLRVWDIKLLKKKGDIEVTLGNLMQTFFKDNKGHKQNLKNSEQELLYEFNGKLLDMYLGLCVTTIRKMTVEKKYPDLLNSDGCNVYGKRQSHALDPAELLAEFPSAFKDYLTSESKYLSNNVFPGPNIPEPLFKKADLTAARARDLENYGQQSPKSKYERKVHADFKRYLENELPLNCRNMYFNLVLNKNPNEVFLTINEINFSNGEVISILPGRNTCIKVIDTLLLIVEQSLKDQRNPIKTILILTDEMKKLAASENLEGEVWAFEWDTENVDFILGTIHLKLRSKVSSHYLLLIASLHKKKIWIYDPMGSKGRVLDLGNAENFLMRKIQNDRELVEFITNHINITKRVIDLIWKEKWYTEPDWRESIRYVGHVDLDHTRLDPTSSGIMIPFSIDILLNALREDYDPEVSWETASEEEKEELFHCRERSALMKMLIDSSDFYDREVMPEDLILEDENQADRDAPQQESTRWEEFQEPPPFYPK